MAGCGCKKNGNQTPQQQPQQQPTQQQPKQTNSIQESIRKVVEKYFDVRGVIFLEDDPDLTTLSKEKYEEMMESLKDVNLSIK